MSSNDPAEASKNEIPETTPSRGYEREHLSM